MQTTKISKTELKGTWFAIVSGMLYGLLGYFGVTVMRSGISVYNLSFWRFLFSFLIVLAIVIARNHKEKRSFSATMSTLINGALFYSGSGVLFFLAANYIGTGQSMVIFFIYPIWLMILNWLFLGQAFRVHYLVSLVLIICGLFLLVDINEFSLDFIGIGLSVLASFCYAIYLFWSKQLNVSPLSSTLLVSFGCLILGLVMALMDNSLAVPSTGEQWLHLMGLAIFATVIPILLMLEAIRYLSSDKASLLSVLEPVFTVIFGVILLQEVLYVHTVFGMIITLIGAMVVIVRLPEFNFGRIKKLG